MKRETRFLQVAGIAAGLLCTLTLMVTHAWAADLTVVHANTSPTRLAQGPDGTVYVTDAPAGSVFLYDADLRLTGELTGLDKPLGITIGSDGSIYIGNDGRDNVEVYSSSGELLRVIGQGSILMPNDMVLDGDDNLYVADSQAHAVKAYDSSGELRRLIGTAADNATALLFPVSLALSRGIRKELFVADQGLSQIQVFDLQGRHLRSLGERIGAFSSKWAGHFATLQSLDIDRSGRLHALDSYLHKCQILHPATGQYMESYGDFGDGPALLNLPLDILLAAEGEALVADNGNGRLVTIPYPGTGPCALEQALNGRNHTRQLELLRSFGSSRLNRAAGLVPLYYTHSREISTILLSEPDLRASLNDLAEAMVPLLTEHLARGTDIPVSQARYRAAVRLLESIETKASPRLRSDISRLLDQIRTGPLLETIGIVADTTGR